MPASSGRRSSTTSAPPSSAAVRNPFWPWPTLISTAGKASASRSQSEPIIDVSPLCGQAERESNDPPDHQQIKSERHRLPDRERKSVGQPRQGRGDEQKIRRIVPAVELRRRAEDRLLAGELLRRVERRIGVAAEDVSAGGIDVGEIGSERPALQVNPPCEVTTRNRKPAADASNSAAATRRMRSRVSQSPLRKIAHARFI